MPCNTADVVRVLFPASRLNKRGLLPAKYQPNWSYSFADDVDFFRRT